MHKSIKSTLKPLKNLICHINDSDYLYWYIRHSNKLQKFHNLHEGESCFIIGNGPSLNQTDLSKLNSYHTFGLNKIYLIFDRVELNLSYHVAVNPLVIKQSVNYFQSLKCPSFLSFRAAKGVIRPLKHVHFIITNGLTTFQSNVQYEAISEGYTVTYVAMQLAYYMGFSQIFLIGVDHNFKVSGSPNEQQLLAGEDPNHFSANYFKDQDWHLPDLEGSELGYHNAKFYYKRDNRIIYDATVGGKLSIFPKISFEEALTLAKRKNSL